MFTFFEGTSLKIARNLIKATGLRESLRFFQSHNISNIQPAEVLKLLLAADACNLLQTMKEDFIAQEIDGEDLQDTAEDYLVENLKAQILIPCRDGAERMDQCQEILEMAAKFQEYWTKEEFKDPGPRFYCVKELLGRLGCEANTPIHDNLFEFIYEQHNRFIRYFRTLLEPFPAEDFVEAPAPSVTLQIPAAERLPEPFTEEGIATEALKEDQPEPADSMRFTYSPQAPIVPQHPVAPALKLPGLDDLAPAPPEPFHGGDPVPSSKPMPQMLDELFRKVNPIDDDFPGLIPPSVPGSITPGEPLPGERPDTSK